MPKVTHLPDTFYDDLEYIASRLLYLLEPEDYKDFCWHLKRKDLVGATRFLEYVCEEESSISFFQLAGMHKHIKPWNVFYKGVVHRIDLWRDINAAIDSWILLMRSCGGSKNAGKLVRAKRRKLPIPKPLKPELSVDESQS